jgi:hypothetical protein
MMRPLFSRPGWAAAQSPQGLRLDLARPFAGDEKHVADLLQRVFFIHLDAEAVSQRGCLPGR